MSSKVKKIDPELTFPESTRAIVRLVVSYDHIPSDDELGELLDNARSYGNPRKAELEITGPFKRDLLTDL